MSIKVAIIGTVGLYIDNDNWDPVTDASVLSQLHGVASAREEEDSFAYYIDASPLRAVGLRGGFIELRYDATTKRLSVVTEYDSPRRLTDLEIDQLVEYTTGQWSDGLGENLECPYASANGLHLDLAPKNQVVRFDQK